MLGLVLYVAGFVAAASTLPTLDSFALMVHHLAADDDFIPCRSRRRRQRLEIRQSQQLEVRRFVGFLFCILRVLMILSQGLIGEGIDAVNHHRTIFLFLILMTTTTTFFSLSFSLNLSTSFEFKKKKKQTTTQARPSCRTGRATTCSRWTASTSSSDPGTTGGSTSGTPLSATGTV